MEKAHTVTILAEDVKALATYMNNLYGTKVTVFCEGVFDNHVYIDTGAPSPILIAQGSIGEVYRALSRFNLGFQIGRDIGYKAASDRANKALENLASLDMPVRFVKK